MRYVVAANHQHYIDPWVITGLIPSSVWRRVGLPRTFVHNRFFEYPVVGFVFRSIGCFPAHQHPTDPYGLPYAFNLLERRHSILIFPEGRMDRNRTREWPAKSGVSVLARQPDVRIIPVHLEWNRTSGRRYVDIGVGPPFDASRMTAQEILDFIFALPVQPVR